MGTLHDKVLDYFKDYKVKKGEHIIYDIRIKDLLMMRAPFKGKGDPWTKVCISENWTYSSLDFLGGKTFSHEFRYTTVCLHILSGIIYQVTNKRSVDFINEVLFEPLGIHSHQEFYAKNAEEHKAFTLNKKPIDHIWFTDPMGICTPGYGLSFSADDLAKIGLMCLNGGIYNNKQIVSKKWIEEMTIPKEIENNNFKGLYYGYLWWIVDLKKHIYAAIGHSGNVLYINPDKDIVISITAYFKPSVLDRIDFIKQYLEPYIISLD